jgi:glycosyltransferase involved in cell wall biosynthesis
MRILLANYRYFVSSGPERYLFNIKKELEKQGHEIIPFSIRYSRNTPTEYERYFASPIAGDDEVFFDQHSGGVKSKAKALSRLFYSREVESRVSRLIADTKPDIAYVLYYLRKLSPSVLVGIKSAGLPIVSRISDFAMFCGEHHMLRNNQPCTLCLDHGRVHQVINRCVKGSLGISAVDAIATRFHQWRGYFDTIDRFVTTNGFMTEMMVRGGIPPHRIRCIPTFTDLQKFVPSNNPPSERYLVYVGRLDRPKGVHLLISAMANLKARLETPPRLKIAGGGHDQSYVAELKAQLDRDGVSDLVELLGEVAQDDVPALLSNAYCCVMPSLWYENLPNVVIESFASGCPVVAANIGSLAQTVSVGENGLHHVPGDAEDLARQLELIIADPELRDRLARGARKTAESLHSPERHTTALLNLLEELLRP